MSGSRVAGVLFIVIGGALAAYTLGLARDSLSDDDFVFRAAMGGVLAGVGIAILVFDPIGRSSSEDVAVLQERHPGQPWLWRDDWAQRYARSEAKSQTRTMGLAGTVCLLISVPILLQFQQEWGKGNWMALAAFVFPLAGLAMAWQGVASRLRELKYGELRFEMAHTPGTAGGKLAGRIAGKSPLPSGTGVELKLSCVHYHVSGTDSDRTRWQKVLWQAEAGGSAVSDGASIYVPVDFEIPYDVRETDSRNHDDEVIWRLEVQAKTPGLDFRSSFAVPVFRTGSSDTGVTAAKLDIERQRDAGPERPAGAKITGSMTATGMRYYLPPARNKAAAAMMTIFGLLFIGSGSFFGYGLSQGLGWIVGAIPLMIFGGIGLLLLLFGVSLWLSATTIELPNHELHIQTSWLGISSMRVIPAEDIARLELHAGMQRGEDVRYDIRVHLTNGRKATAGSGMRRDEADWLAAGIRNGLGLREHQS